MAVIEKSRNDLINGNYGLVHSCANRFRGRGVEYDDLFQAGCIGLIKAVDGFDESRGFAFSTYAVPVILGEIRRIFRDGGAIKVGRAMKEKARNALKLKEELSNQFGKEPTITQLSEAMGVDVYEAAQILGSAQPPLSLTAEDGSAGQLDVAVAPPEEEISDALALHEVLGHLPPQDRTLIFLRYFKGLTQMKTAKQLGMSQVQVSRREKAILGRLRQELNE